FPCPGHAASARSAVPGRRPLSGVGWPASGACAAVAAEPIGPPSPSGAPTASMASTGSWVRSCPRRTVRLARWTSAAVARATSRASPRCAAGPLPRCRSSTSPLLISTWLPSSRATAARRAPATRSDSSWWQCERGRSTVIVKTPNEATITEQPRPAAVCRRLLAALEATEGRRRKRKRNTAPDALGLAIKRELFEAVIEADPDPDDFEAWLLAYCQRFGLSSGPVRAMA